MSMAVGGHKRPVPGIYVYVSGTSTPRQPIKSPGFHPRATSLCSGPARPCINASYLPAQAHPYPSFKRLSGMASISLDIKSELPTAIRWTNEHTKQLAYSISQALNASAQGSRFIPGSQARSALNALADQSSRFLDRPKPQTSKGFRATVANKTNLSVLITPKDKPWSRNRYLSGNILGGARAPKPFEIAFAANSKGNIPSGSRFVPTGAVKPDRYGNVSKSNLNKIVQSIGNDNRTGANVFIGKPLGGARPAGVYRRERTETLRPLFLVDSSVNYTPRFPATRLAQQQVQRTFGAYLRQQLAKNVANAVPSTRGSFLG